MKNNIILVVIILLFCDFVYGLSYGWPLREYDEQQRIKGTFGEYRIYNGNEYFHNGIDIPAPEGFTVKPAFDGFFHEIRNNGNTIVILLDIESENEQYMTYHHLKNIPDFTRGDEVIAGETRLGELDDNNHLHFIDGSIDTYRYNPLGVPFLTPFSDNLDPVIESIKFVKEIDEYSTSYEEIDVQSIEIGEKIDIVIDAYDRIPNGLSDDRPGIYQIKINIFDPDGTKLTNEEHSLIFKTGFDRPDEVRPKENLVYAPGSTMSNFLYVPTNCDEKDGNFNFNGNWDTTPCMAGEYLIESNIIDHAGNSKIQQRTILFKNQSGSDPNPGQIGIGETTIDPSQEVDVVYYLTDFEGNYVEWNGTVDLASSDNGSLTFELYGETNSGEILLNLITHDITGDNQTDEYIIPYPPLEFFDNSQFIELDSDNYKGKILIKNDDNILIETLNNVKINKFNGNIVFNKTWQGNNSLYSNVFIKSDVNVGIDAGSIINLNSNKISLENNAALSMHAESSLLPHIVQKNSSIVKAYHPSILSAIADATSNQTIIIGSSLTLTENLSMPLDVSLVIIDGVINLEAYNVTTNGGSINFSGGSVSPKIQLKSGSSIVGLYPDVASALAAATNSQIIEVYGSHNISNDLVVPTGITLKPMPGSDIKFESGKKLIVNGTLNAENVTFTKSETTEWYGIVYEDGSSGIIQNCNINNSNYGIYCKSSTLYIIGNTFLNNTYALYIYNSSPDIKSNKVTNDYVYLNNSNSYMDDNYFSNNSGAYCLKIYSSSPEIFNHTIIGEISTGITVDNASMPFFGEAAVKGYNYIYNNGDTFTITANNSSDVVLGTGSDAGPYFCGYNTILAGRDALGEAYASSNSQINAKYCWWGQATPPNLGPNISTDYALDINPGGGSSLAKSVNSNNSNDHIIDLPFNSKADSLLNLALNLLENKDSKSAKNIFKLIIKQYPDLHYAHKALFQILHIYKKEKNINSKKELKYLLKEIKKSDISVAIQNRIISANRKQKGFKTAIKELKKISKQFPKTKYEYYALFDLFNIYQKDLKDDNTAEKILMEMIEKFPDEEYTLMAQFDADNIVEGYENYQEYKEQVDLVKDTEGVNLFDAYPNPFNPETTISYILPKQSNVTIRIYDLAGNLVKTLVDERNKPQGCYNVVWNATDMSSGVYFYQITAGSISQVKKCLLIK